MSLNGALRRTGPLWGELRQIMRAHIDPGDDEIDTFNRLLVKRRERFEPTLMLNIPDDGVRIGAEDWNLEALWRLLHPSQIVDDEPNKPEGAVVVLRWDGRDFLMDGR